MKTVYLVNTPAPPSRHVSRSMMGGLGFGSGKGMLLPPLDLALIAAVLRNQGMQAVIVDPDADGTTLEDVVGRMSRDRADACVATVALPTLEHDCAYAASIGRAAGVPVFLKTFIRQDVILKEVLEKSGASAAMTGEPDFSAGAILFEGLREGTAELRAGALTLTPMKMIENLDDLPVAARDLLEGRYVYPLLGEPVATVQSSRGCPYPCGYYCPYPLVEGKKWRPQSPERMMREMRAVAECGLHRVLFRDATFTIDRERVREFCRLLRESRIEFEWWCETRADLLDEELLRDMAAAGCKGVNVGVETGDEEVRNSLAKRGVTRRRLREAVEAGRRHGVKFHFLLEVGLPGETRKSIVETFNLLEQLAPESMGVTFTTPYPGTALYEDARKNGWLLSERWEDYDALTPIFRTATLTRDEIAAARNIVEEGFSLIRNRPVLGDTVYRRQRRLFYTGLLRWACRLDRAESQSLSWLKSPPWFRAIRAVWRALPLSENLRIRLKRLAGRSF